MDSEMSDEDLVALADKAEAVYRESEGSPILPIAKREWSQNAQDWLDDVDLVIPELNNVQYGEGRRPRQRDPLFEVVNSYVCEYKKFETTGTCYNLKIADPDPKVVPENWLHIKPFDRIGMSLKNSVCGTEPVYISIRRADQLSVDVILENIMNIFDSNKAFFLNGHLTVHFDHIRMEHEIEHFAQLEESNFPPVNGK